MPQGPNHALFYSCAVPPDASSVYNTERIPKIERNRTRLVVPHMVSPSQEAFSGFRRIWTADEYALHDLRFLGGLLRSAPIVCAHY
jgi:hypothetical protein